MNMDQYELLKYCIRCGKIIPTDRLKINSRWGKPTSHCSHSCYRKDYYIKNKIKEDNRNKKYNEKNKDKVSKYSANWYKENKKRLDPIRKEYRQTHKEQIRAKDERWLKKNEIMRLKKKIANNIRQRLKLKNFKKNKHTEEILGCSIEFFKNYLEQQFKDNMTWDNYGVSGWHIDHKTPMQKAKTIDEAYELWHYTNLQPLWAKDNLEKGIK